MQSFFTRSYFSMYNLETPAAAKRRNPSILLVPIAIATGLGIWQLYRKQWKLSLVEKLTSRLNEPEWEITTESLKKLNALDPLVEYKDNDSEKPVLLHSHPETQFQDKVWTPVRATGKYLHHFSMPVGPKTHQGQTGYFVVTPMVLEDNKTVILINRGFVPKSSLFTLDRRLVVQRDDCIHWWDMTGIDYALDPHCHIEKVRNETTKLSSWERHKDQPLVNVKGILRPPQHSSNMFLSEPEYDTNSWFYYDTRSMLQRTWHLWNSSFPIDSTQILTSILIHASDAELVDDTQPIMLGDNEEKWPKPIPANVELPDNHYEYAATWFTLAGICSGLWIHLKRGLK